MHLVNSEPFINTSIPWLVLSMDYANYIYYAYVYAAPSQIYFKTCVASAYTYLWHTKNFTEES